MKQSMRVTHGAALLAAGIGLCLTAGSAHAQRGGGRGGGNFQSTRAASATGQTGGSGSGMSGGCSNGGSSSSSSTTSTGTATGTTMSGQVTAQSTGTVTAQRTAANAAIVQYSGSTSSVKQIYLAVLDANGDVVSQRLVTPSRAIATLAVNSSARYYGAMVVYANGTTRTTYTAVR